MAERYDVLARVVSQKGTCAAGNKVGDEWLLGRRTPAGMCLDAFSALYPNFRVLRFGGALPWATDSDIVRVACPDPENPVVFELKRLRK